jgi:hypothetical protein
MQMDVSHWLLAQLILKQDNVTSIKMELLQMQMVELHQQENVFGMKQLDHAEINNVKTLH